MKKFTDIEFHTTPEGDVLIKQADCAYKELVESDTEFINYMADRIKNDYTEC